MEQDAEEIWESVRRAVAGCLAELDPAAVVAVGLSNQRESVGAWERSSGSPLGPILSWQDQRTAPLCREVRMDPAKIFAISGLPLDPMFSALKARWLLDHHDPERRRSRSGEICIGTVDSWLLSRCAKADDQHVVEIGNASRTQLLDLDGRTWSADLLDEFDVPPAVLPEIRPSDGPFPTVRGLDPLPDGVPVLAVLGDSHAALFGHGIRTAGVVKVTYGTGSSVMALVADDHGGNERGHSAGVCRTIAWQVGDVSVAYALEGNIRSTGATLQWLARLLGTTAGDLAEVAATASSDGVHLVPGFNGLAAPWWDAEATGLLTGLSLSTGPAQVARSALESTAFQVADVVDAIRAQGVVVDRILADGGGSGNDTLMQIQADLAGVTVERSARPDVSALGAAYLAGLRAGLWTEDQLVDLVEQRETFHPQAHDRGARMAEWHDAIRRARGTTGRTG